MFKGMSADVHQKMLMYMKQMLMYRRKDCQMKFHLCTSPRTSNEFDVHQNADPNVQEVGGLTNERVFVIYFNLNLSNFTLPSRNY